MGRDLLASEALQAVQPGHCHRRPAAAPSSDSTNAGAAVGSADRQHCDVAAYKRQGWSTAVSGSSIWQSLLQNAGRAEPRMNQSGSSRSKCDTSRYAIGRNHIAAGTLSLWACCLRPPAPSEQEHHPVDPPCMPLWPLHACFSSPWTINWQCSRFHYISIKSKGACFSAL